MDAAAPAQTVDGNAIAGMLWDLFGADVTALVGTCGGCGALAAFAEAVVELDRHAAIVRCRTCTRTLFTVLQSPDGTSMRVGLLQSFHSPPLTRRYCPAVS